MTPARGLPVALAVVLTGLSVSGLAITGTTASAAARPQPTASPADAATSSSFGYVAAGPSTFDQLSGLTTGPIATGPAISTDGYAIASAITPDGSSAMFTDYKPELAQLDGIGSATAAAGPTIDVSAYVGEGAADYQPFTTGVSLTNTFGLAALDSQGVLALRLVDGAWTIDTRVQSPGDNELGQPHQPGWLRFGATGETSVYDGVVVSQVPEPDGKTIALATSRGSAKGVISVVTGVGSADPKLAGRLRSADLKRVEPPIDDTGTGGVAFSPATPARAVVATSNGFDSIDLRKPTHPKILAATPAGKAGHTTAIAVAPDGNHVAVASGDQIRIFKGLLHTSGPLPMIGKVTLNAVNVTPTVTAMGYLLDGRLAIENSGDGPADGTAWFATIVAKADTSSPKLGTSTALTGAPEEGNSMSLSPAITQPVIRLKPTTAKAGKPAKLKLSVHDGLGNYRFTVTAGKLPAGLSVVGDKIVGTPKHSATKMVSLRAVNQYRGGAFGSVTVIIK